MVYYFFSFVVALVELLSAGFALNDRIDGFQVGWISHDGQADVFVGDTVKALDVCTQVIFDVTRAL